MNATTSTVSAETVVDELSRVWDRDDVIAAVDALIDAGLDIEDQPDDDTILTAGEVELVRSQLTVSERLSGPDVALARHTLAMTVSELGRSLPNPQTGAPLNERTIRSWESGRDVPGVWVRHALDVLVDEVDRLARQAVAVGVFELRRGESRDLAVAARARQLDPWIRLDWAE